MHALIKDLDRILQVESLREDSLDTIADAKAFVESATKAIKDAHEREEKYLGEMRRLENTLALLSNDKDRHWYKLGMEHLIEILKNVTAR